MTSRQIIAVVLGLGLALAFAAGCSDKRKPGASPEPTAPPATADAPDAPQVDAAADAAIDARLHASKWPHCTESEFDASDFVPADARPHGEALARPLAANDPAPIVALLADRVRLDQSTSSRDSIAARLTQDGPQAVIGFEPDEYFDTEANAKRCVWKPGSAPGGDRDTFELYTGSGYGDTRIVRLTKRDDRWQIILIETVDYGPP